MKECACQHLLGSLADYLDDHAAAELCAEIETHLATCPDCRVVVDTMKKTITLVHQTPKPTMPDAAKEKLMQVLKLDDYISKD